MNLKTSFVKHWRVMLVFARNSLMIESQFWKHSEQIGLSVISSLVSWVIWSAERIRNISDEEKIIIFFLKFAGELNRGFHLNETKMSASYFLETFNSSIKINNERFKKGVDRVEKELSTGISSEIKDRVIDFMRVFHTNMTLAEAERAVVSFWE